MTADLAIAQAAEELSAASGRLHACGLVFADPSDERARGQIQAAAAAIVAELRQEGVDRKARANQTCVQLMDALWTHGAPEDVGAADWWRTALGQLCARQMGQTDVKAVTYSTAASMLGVRKGTVSVLVQRGTIERHPDGGVLRASVLQRIGR